MKKPGIFIAKVLVSLIFIVVVLGLVAVFSLNIHVNEENIEEIASEIATEIVTEEILNVSGIDGGDNDAALIERCKNEQNFLIEEFDLEIDCNKIVSASSENVNEIIESEIEGKIDGEIQKFDFARFLVFVDLSFLILGFLAAVFLVVIFFLNSPKYKFLINLGVVGIVVGLFFVFSIAVNTSGLEGTRYDVLRGLLNSIIDSFFTNLLIVLIFGVALLFVGILIDGFYKRRKLSGKSKYSVKK